MKATELRIGNCIQWSNNIIMEEFEEVNYITKKTIGLESDIKFDTLTPIELFEPIPLTEEWLLKFGFTKDDSRDQKLSKRFFLNKHNHNVIIQEYDNTEWIFVWELSFMGKSFQYVHQLQNIYFALTENELEIKI